MKHEPGAVGEGDENGPSIINDTARVLSLGFSALTTRLHLGLIETEELLHNLSKALMLSVAAIALLMTLLVFSGTAIIVQCWDSCREQAAWGVVAGFGVLFVAVGLIAWRCWHGMHFFADTINQLREDASQLGK